MTTLPARDGRLFDLGSRVALVTGASSGLGVTFARALASAGADLTIAARRADGLSRTASTIEGLGRRCLAVPTDVTSESQVERLVAAAIDTYGRIDILVNCAGTIGGHRMDDTRVEEFEGILRSNVVSAFICCQKVGPHMCERGGGRIINIASVFGLVAGRPRGPSLSYVTSKHALVGLTKELAVQWARRGVTVNAIAPAYFQSEMVTSEFLHREDFVRDLEVMSAMGRPGELSELEGVMVFLASEASSYITGQTICVDGGWTVR